MDIHNYERENLGASRILILKNCFKSLGLDSVIDKIDESIAIAALYAQGELIAEGAGKGKSCEIGALAEAFEHYCLQNEILNETPIEAAKIAKQHALHSDGVIQSLSCFNEHVEVVKFKSLFGEDEIAIPQLLVSPRDALPEGICHKIIERYATNSGTALGCSFEEAILHGLNEVIERHILSLLMLDSIGEGCEVKTHEISKKNINCLLSCIDFKPHGSIRVYFVDDLLGSFFCLAVRDGEEDTFSLPQIGSGCSQSFLLAFSRAVFELVQAETLYGYEERCIDEQAIRIISRSKRLEGLRKMRPISSKVTDYLPEPNGKFPNRPREQVNSALNSLKRSEFAPYYRVLNEMASSVFVVQVYVPGMERFNLIRSGKWVAPHAALLHSPFDKES